MTGRVLKLASLSAGTALFAATLPYLTRLSSSLVALLPDFPIPDYPFSVPTFLRSESSELGPLPPFVCDAFHTYKTELVSLDPLVIYIHDLLTPAEIDSLLTTAEPAFAPSTVILGGGRRERTNDRTSSSAGLPRDDPAVVCVLNRARRFMGTMMRDGWDDMGPPQLVRYRRGQRFNLHHDWYDHPRWSTTEGDMRKWNRVASFFAILQDNCTGGETHFPFIYGIAPQSPMGESLWKGETENTENQDGEEKEDQRNTESKPLWREHEDGGLAFRPVAGNAIFWVNLHSNGTGDLRTRHAGLPLVDGLKTAMNIWPRQFYPYE